MADESQHYGSQISLAKFFRIFFDILKPEGNFYWLAAVYGVGISLLSLATPISVQMLINTIANTALTAPLVLLARGWCTCGLASATYPARRVVGVRVEAGYRY